MTPAGDVAAPPGMGPEDLIGDGGGAVAPRVPDHAPHASGWADRHDAD